MGARLLLYQCCECLLVRLEFEIKLEPPLLSRTTAAATAPTAATAALC